MHCVVSIQPGSVPQQIRCRTIYFTFHAYQDHLCAQWADHKLIHALVVTSLYPDIDAACAVPMKFSVLHAYSDG